MTGRVFVAGLLGAILMFIWTSLAHTVLPLGQTGISQLSGEPVMLGAMKAATNDRPGLYLFPWIDMKAPDAMQRASATLKANPSGLLMYNPAGQGVSDMGAPMVKEFVKELIQALIAALIASMIVGATFIGRLGVVVLIGVSGTLMTNASYWIWYRFPLPYTGAMFVIDIVGALFAGLAIAWWLGRRISAPALAPAE